MVSTTSNSRVPERISLLPSVSIITPSHNMLRYLKLCAASIADQNGVDVEHIVVDAQSSDGTQRWLANQNSIRWMSEEDHGMYDAVNKGMKLARGEILAYLNCDEQYLPGTLKFVQNYFDNNPQTDIVFGNFLAVDDNGCLIAYRKSHHPYRSLILSSYLYVFTCTMFFRRKVIESGIFFDDRMKTIGDCDFVIRLLEKGFRAGHVPKYFSTFVMTGSNLMNSAMSVKEFSNYVHAKAPFIKLIRLPLNAIRLALKFFAGAYFEKAPLEYSIFTFEDLTKRKRFVTKDLKFRLKPKTQLELRAE